MSRPSIGTLRHRLVIEAPVETTDANGDRRIVFQEAGEMWGDIEPLRDAGRFEADRAEQLTTHVVHARWRADVVAGMRLRMADRALLIRAVRNPDEQKIRINFLCEEVQ